MKLRVGYNKFACRSLPRATAWLTWPLPALLQLLGCGSQMLGTGTGRTGTRWKHTIHTIHRIPRYKHWSAKAEKRTHRPRMIRLCGCFPRVHKQWDETCAGLAVLSKTSEHRQTRAHSLDPGGKCSPTSGRTAHVIWKAMLPMTKRCTGALNIMVAATIAVSAS